MSFLYISVQPAEPYFLWQLEIQLHNFRQIGIDMENVHVLLGYKPSNGLPSLFDKLIKKSDAKFYFYSDTRPKGYQYTSSIRPHLLKKHFESFPNLSERTIFYHDSDIIFRERIEENKFQKDNIWYLSDTINYLSASYLDSFGKDLLVNMCSVMDISPKKVIDNILNTGGAQHIMKNVNSNYWNDVEKDSEAIFIFLTQHNANREDNKKIQVWCADMWALLWNAWKRNIETRIDPELDFCWPKDHISKWYSTKILHNAGVFQKDKNEYFCKLIYKHTKPYFIDYSNLKTNTCSEIFVSKIKELEKDQPSEELSRLSIVLLANNIDINKQNKLLNYLRYLRKHIECSIIILEEGDWPRLNKKKLTEYGSYHFIGESMTSKFIKRYVRSKYFLFSDSSILLPIENIKKGYISLTTASSETLVIPYDNLKRADIEFHSRFRELLEIDKKKIKNLSTSTNNTYSECFIVDKKTYLLSGGENKHFTFFKRDGFNLEREVRFRILGFSVIYIKKTAVKLYEQISKERKNIDKKDYLSICRYTKDDLKRCIASKHYSESYVYTIPPAISLPIDVYCINLKKRTDRTCHVLSQFKNRTEFSLIIFEAVEHKVGNIGLWNSLIAILQLAKRNNLKHLIICEDDIQFTSFYSSDRMYNTIKEMYSYGIQMLIGGSTGGHRQTHRISDNLVWIDQYWSNHFLVIHHTCFDKIINHNYDAKKAVDITLSEVILHKAIMVPFIATQAIFGYSDVTPYNNENPNSIIKRFYDNEQKLKYLINALE